MQVSDTFNCNYGGKPSLFWASDPNNQSLGTPSFLRVRALSFTPLGKAERSRVCQSLQEFVCAGGGFWDL